jgi:hypothetical protein
MENCRMGDPFALLSEYFWLVALIFGAINYLIAVRRLAKSSTVPSHRIPEARAYLLRLNLLGAALWLAMGVGQLSGLAPTIWHYFRPQDGNLFVTGWFAAFFASALACSAWILFAGGAKKIIELDLMPSAGSFDLSPKSETLVKIYAVIGPLLLLAWIGLVVLMDAPLPKA